MVTIVVEMGVHFLSNLSINLDGIQCAARTCSFVEAHAKFMLHK